MNENSFYSMDRLMEFGLSMAMAQQMVKTMNNTINTIQVPGAGNPIPISPNSLFYTVIEGKQAGPFSESELSQLIRDKSVDKKTYIWKPGMSNWLQAENIPEVLKLVCLTPPTFINEEE